MKKVISILLAVALIISLSACEKRIKISEEKVKEVFATFDGTLNIDGKSDDIAGFTYVLDGVYAEGLAREDYVTSVYLLTLDAMKSGNNGNFTLKDAYAASAIGALLSIDILFEKSSETNENSVNLGDFLDRLIDILCNGGSWTYSNWTVSAKIDVEKDRMIIIAESK